MPIADIPQPAFALKLRRAWKQISRDARGRTCGSCTHAILSSSGSGFCGELANMWGDQVQIRRPDAVACPEWRRGA